MSIQYGEPDMAGSYGVVDSFPKDFGYGGDEAGIDDDSSASADTQPRILLMGLRRSGKSSIQKVSVVVHLRLLKRKDMHRLTVLHVEMRNFVLVTHAHIGS